MIDKLKKCHQCGQKSITIVKTKEIEVGKYTEIRCNDCDIVYQHYTNWYIRPQIGVLGEDNYMEKHKQKIFKILLTVEAESIQGHHETECHCEQKDCDHLDDSPITYCSACEEINHTSVPGFDVGVNSLCRKCVKEFTEFKK